ncbi:hypothetical protein EXIGLDRAFT_760455 [Exidia glandulosa HHB12029]|uniref:F-box domain-containing protein n=1 Tax=Exidia glandulosa HHB12029 TaxID=1314781 RepID=A0A166BK65_EXIGL|nr:hypothetical protein EXIGLDRAFT_760455 [Exidia glandulosa HHB12029]
MSAPNPSTSLPFELRTAILNHLTQPEVLRAAAVDSLWRSAAKAHPNYYRNITIDAPTIASREAEYTLASELSAGRYAQVQVRLSIRVEWSDSVLVFVRILGLMPRLVKLIVQPTNTSAFDAENFLNLLCKAAAPQLRTFKFSIDTKRSWFDKNGTYRVEIPSNLFDSHAPKLRHVALKSVAFTSSHGLPTAFAHVTKVNCRDVHFPLSQGSSMSVVREVFPRVTDLTMHD